MLFEGIWPAVTTPFDQDNEVHEVALAEHVDWLIKSGVHGIVGVGTVGDSISLRSTERRKVTSMIIQAAGGRVPVVIGVSSETALDASEWATHAAAEGAQAVMCLPPLLYAADPDETIRFFETVAAATDLPMMAYNNPGASHSDLDPATIARVCDIENVRAVKECSGDARRIAAILDLVGGGAEVLVGGDDWALEGFFAGATGWVSGCANVAPKECVSLFEYCMHGKLEAARDLYSRLLPLARLDMTPKLVQFFKAALDRSGRYGGPNRPPRLELTDAELGLVDSALETLANGSMAARQGDQVS